MKTVISFVGNKLVFVCRLNKKNVHDYDSLTYFESFAKLNEPFLKENLFTYGTNENERQTEK